MFVYGNAKIIAICSYVIDSESNTYRHQSINISISQFVDPSWEVGSSL